MNEVDYLAAAVLLAFSMSWAIVAAWQEAQAG